MKVEELLELLKQSGLGEEEIEVLLAEAIKAIHPEEQPHEEIIEEKDDDKKIEEVFGI